MEEAGNANLPARPGPESRPVLRGLNLDGIVKKTIYRVALHPSSLRRTISTLCPRDSGALAAELFPLPFEKVLIWFFLRVRQGSLRKRLQFSRRGGRDLQGRLPGIPPETFLEGRTLPDAQGGHRGKIDSLIIARRRTDLRRRRGGKGGRLPLPQFSAFRTSSIFCESSPREAGFWINPLQP